MAVYKMKTMNKYPWDKWFSRKTPVVLTRGKDYTGKTVGFVIYARQVAKARGYRLTVNVLPNDQGIAFLAEKKVPNGRVHSPVRSKK